MIVISFGIHFESNNIKAILLNTIKLNLNINLMINIARLDH